MNIKKKVVASYQHFIVKVYCKIRFIIINQRILDEIDQYIPSDGRIIDIGCGFGLFSLYFALQAPYRKITAYDLSESRIITAGSSAAILGIEERITFECQDAVSVRKYENTYNAAYLLDILHHIPPSEHRAVLQAIYQALAPGGILIVKEIDTFPKWKTLFTWMLDMAMSPKMPPHYISRDELRALLMDIGFDVKIHSQLDTLPYPHVLFICRKTQCDFDKK